MALNFSHKNIKILKYGNQKNSFHKNLTIPLHRENALHIGIIIANI